MICTDRLVLRPVEDGDLDDLFRIYSDPMVMRYISEPHPDRARTARMIEAIKASHAETGLEFVVERQGEVIGKSGLWKIAEIGYAFRPDQWGQGIGREAVGAVVTAGLARFPELEAITAEIDPRNLASARLLTRLGFVETHREERTTKLGGEWCDSGYWQLTRPE